MHLEGLYVLLVWSVADFSSCQVSGSSCDVLTCVCQRQPSASVLGVWPGLTFDLYSRTFFMQINSYVTAQRCELKRHSLQFIADQIHIERTFSNTPVQ